MQLYDLLYIIPSPNTKNDVEKINQVITSHTILIFLYNLWIILNISLTNFSFYYTIRLAKGYYD